MGLDCYPITDDFENEVQILDKYYDNIVVLDYIYDDRFESDDLEYPVLRRIYNQDTQDISKFLYKFICVPYEVSYNSQTVTIYDYQDKIN